MSREIKFKAQLKCNDGKYRWFEDTGTVFHRFQNTGDLKSDTICQLITKIGDVEIYEYDCCYFDKLIYKLFYDKNGFLEQKIYCEIDNKLLVINEYMRANPNALINISQGIFIGNWHDGEEYLLSKIKGLANE